MPRGNITSQSPQGQPEDPNSHGFLGTHDGRPCLAVFDPDSPSMVRLVKYLDDRRLPLPFDAIPQAVHDDIAAGWLPAMATTVLAVMLRFAFSAREKGYGDGKSAWATNEAVGELIQRSPRQVRNIRKAILSRGWLRRDTVGPSDPSDPRNRTGERWVCAWMTDEMPPRDPSETAPVKLKRGRPLGGGRKLISPPEEFVSSPPQELVSPHRGEEIHYRDGGKLITPNVDLNLIGDLRRQTEFAGEGSTESLGSSSRDFAEGAEEPEPAVETMVIPAIAPAPPPGPRAVLPPSSDQSPIEIPTALPAALAQRWRSLKLDPCESVAATPTQILAGPTDEASRRGLAAFRLVDQLWRRGLRFRSNPQGQLEWFPPTPYLQVPTATELGELARLRHEVGKELRDRGVRVPDTKADIEEAGKGWLPDQARKLISDQAKLAEVLGDLPKMIDLVKDHTKFPVRAVHKAIKEAVNRSKGQPDSIARYVLSALEGKIREKKLP